MKSRLFVLLFLLFLVSFPLSLAAQELVALHPFKGEAEDERITYLFFQRMQRELPNARGGNYRGFAIDLDNLPSDVPPGGFPPWVCPSPSITGDAPFAITGEASPDLDYEGAFRMRLYAWKMEGTRLVGSDEITIMSLEDLASLPVFLDWVLSWFEEEMQDPVVIYGEPEIVLVQQEPLAENWLYLGMRFGGGYSRWTYDYSTISSTHEVTTFASINFTLQAAFFFTRFLALQTELNFISDFKSETDQGEFSALSLTVPVMVKFVLQGQHVRAGIFGGLFLHIPLTQQGSAAAVNHYDYRSDFPGFVFGLSTGIKLGPGYIFLDGRFAYDGHWFSEKQNSINYRSSTRLNIGYEIGFFRKNRD